MGKRDFVSLRCLTDWYPILYKAPVYDCAKYHCLLSCLHTPKANQTWIAFHMNNVLAGDKMEFVHRIPSAIMYSIISCIATQIPIQYILLLLLFSLFWKRKLCCASHVLLSMHIYIPWRPCTINAFRADSMRRITHICISKITITVSDNGLWCDRLQAIIWSNVVKLLTATLGTTFSQNCSEIHTMAFHSRKCISKCGLRKGGNFVSVSMW